MEEQQRSASRCRHLKFANGELVMLLKEICTPDVVCCGSATSALAAARIMRQKHVGALVIVDDDEDQLPLGIITDRDIVVEVLGNDRDPAVTKVHEIVCSPVVIAYETEDTSQAVERMRAHGVRRLPVLDARRKVVGIISLDDLVKQLAVDASALSDIVAREQRHEHRVRK
jgi:CBS domain-containing protein